MNIQIELEDLDLECHVNYLEVFDEDRSMVQGDLVVAFIS